MAVCIENSEYAIKKAIDQIEGSIRVEVKRRAQTVTDYMKDSSVKVLSGERHGAKRTYYGKHYTASAPGESPAQRSGALSHSFKPETTIVEDEDGMMIHSRISSNLPYAGHLDEGWGRIAPRPYGNRIFDKSVVRASIEFRRPYYDRISY